MATLNLDTQALYASFAAFAQTLPDKSRYQKTDLFNPAVRLHDADNIAIYYVPGDYINKYAKIHLLGITPGWTQMEIFYRAARTAILKGNSPMDASHEAKRQARFAGSMRANLIAMLNRLEITQYLGIACASSLFSSNEHLIHTSSVLRYPVFVEGRNYSGHQFHPLRHKALTQMIDTLLVPELQQTHNAFIVPLGNIVGQILQHLVDTQRLDARRCCFGFPHPSGANGHRQRQLSENRPHLMRQMQQWFGQK